MDAANEVNSGEAPEWETRLAQECAKLDPREEREWAELGIEPELKYGSKEEHLTNHDY